MDDDQETGHRKNVPGMEDPEMNLNPFQSMVLTLVVVLALLSPPATASDRFLFDSEQTFELGDIAWVFDSAIGDLDNDGHLDYLFNTRPESPDYCLIALPGRGDGTFDPPVETILPTSSTFKEIILHDVDDDGILDVLMTLDDSLHLFAGRGDCTFELLGTYESAIFYAVGDIDNDGHPDIAGTLNMDFSGYLAILYGEGNGIFGDRRLYPIGKSWAGSLVLNDFDGDGNLDVALNGGEHHGTYYSSWEEGPFIVFIGRGDRTFFDPQQYGDDEVYYRIFSADLNGDQLPELLRTFVPYDDLGTGVTDIIEILPNIGSGTFGSPYTIESTDRAHSISAADLDNDGWTDLAAMGESGAAVHLGDGSGGFIAHHRYPSCGGYSPGLADLDEDGSPDLLTMTSLGGHGSILFGRGDGRIGAARTVDMQNDEPVDITAGDFNADGYMDLAVIYDWREETVLHAGLVILTGNGTGDLTVAWSYEMDDNYLINLVSVDLNHDDLLDLVGADFGHEGTVSVMLGNGDGTFGAPARYPVAQGPADYCEDLAIADFDGDGHPDLATANSVSDSISVARGHGDGTLGQPTFTSVGDKPVSLCTGDFNEDGAPDLATANAVSDDLSILINTGTGAFADPVTTGTWFSETVAVATGDLDGDGHLDLAALTKDQVETLLGAGDGSFSLGPEREVDIRYASSHYLGRPDLLLDDFNRDGETDLVVAHVGLQFCSSAGEGTFDDPVRFCTADMHRAVAADLNGDGSPDLAARIRAARDVCILLSQPGLGLLAAGTGPGPNNPPLVRLFHPTQASPLVSQWLPYGSSGFGVNVAFGDLDGSGTATLVTGPGPGPILGPHVRAFRTDGTPISQVSFLAYGTLRYGVNVSCGDIDGDGRDEIVTGAGPGAVFGPHVRGWDWDGQGPVQPLPEVSYFAYGTPKWGTNVSCGDMDGDGRAEIITGPGPGQVYGPHVRGWSWSGPGSPVLPIGGVSFFAYGTLQWGVRICSGDVDGDGMAEIVTAPGPGSFFGPHIRAWDWDGEGTARPIPGVSFFAYDGLGWGATVASGDIDGDGIDEIITGPGPAPGNPARIRGWDYDGLALTAIPDIDFTAFDPATTGHGVTVGIY